MAKYGVHAFVWIDEWTVEKGNFVINEAAKLGFDFIEVPLLRPDEFEVKAHKKTLEQARIGVTGSVALPKDAHMPNYPEKANKFLIGVLDKLQELGGNYLCGCLACALGVFTGKPPSEEERQVVIETLKEVASEAKKRGITLGLEAVNRYESYMYNSLEDVRAAIRKIDANNIELHADTYHMNIEENGFYNPLLACADVLGYIHMSESHRGVLGTGTVNWDEVFRGLADAKYKGPMVLESFAAINPDLAAATCLWRLPNVEPSFLAMEGLRFLRAGAERAGL